VSPHKSDWIGQILGRKQEECQCSFLNRTVDKPLPLPYVVLNQRVEQKGSAVADDQLSRVFAALADPTRRDMVARLAVGDATVGELAGPYDVSMQAVSKHVKVLADAGLVTQSKDAQRRPCHLEAEVFDLMTKWIERYRQQAQERYERLDDVLAEMRGEARTDDIRAEGAAS
jgi:DNA-binding transcriptional ArsR family regulator